MESSAIGGEQREDKGAQKPAHIHRSLAREGLRRGREGGVRGSVRGGGRQREAAEAGGWLEERRE